MHFPTCPPQVESHTAYSRPISLLSIFVSTCTILDAILNERLPIEPYEFNLWRDLTQPGGSGEYLRIEDDAFVLSEDGTIYVLVEEWGERFMRRSRQASPIGIASVPPFVVTSSFAYSPQVTAPTSLSAPPPTDAFVITSDAP